MEILKKIKSPVLLRHVFFAGTAILIALMDRTPLDLDLRFNNDAIKSGFYLMYDGILNNTIEAPYPYRFLIPYLIKWLSDLGSCTPILMAFLLNVVFIFTVLSLFFVYASRYLEPFTAFVTTYMIAFYILVIQSQFIGITVVESQDMLNAVFFLMLLWLAAKEQWLWFSLVMLVSVMNRETPLILLAPFGYLFFRKRDLKNLLLIALPGLLMYFGIRYYLPVHIGNYPDFTNLRTNFPGVDSTFFWKAVQNNVQLFCMIGPMVLLAFYDFLKQSLENKALLLVTVPFLIIHYLMGSILEIRLFFPLIVVILPYMITNLKLLFEK